MKLFTQQPRTCEYANAVSLPKDNILLPHDNDPADITLAIAFEREQYLPGLDITGGRYAALSLDNCFGCTIEGAVIDPRASRHGIVIADHSDGNWLDNVRFDTHAKGADIVIGWRPGLVPSSDWYTAGKVVLRDVNAADGKPVRVVVWGAPPPTVINSNVSVRIINPRFVRGAQWLNRKGLLP